MAVNDRPKADTADRPKVLLLDDDEHFLELYHELLSAHLTCLPEVITSSSAISALGVLDTQLFDLLIVDLNMPKMDGLQVLCVARRKFPQLKVVVLTGVRDEQFRTRAYAMGVDQYWVKPESDQELGLFIESIDSLLQRDAQQGGFRGVQSKSLVDIIQLECLSQSSCLLKISNNMLEGRIWIQHGEVIDAEASGMVAEPAFQHILTWKAGSFELLPGDPKRPRTIFTSYQGLLLNTAQALDEAVSEGRLPVEPSADAPAGPAGKKLCPGMQFVLTLKPDPEAPPECWGLDNPQLMAEWTRQTLESFEKLSTRLQVGPMQQVLCTGPLRKLAVLSNGEGKLCVGFTPTMPAEQVQSSLKQFLTTWGS